MKKQSISCDLIKKETVFCDECGKAKEKANHWFVASALGPRIIIAPADSRGVIENSDITDDLCGQACVIKAVQKWMDAQSGKCTRGLTFTQDIPISAPEYRHKPQCAMTCSDGAEMCDCVPGTQIESKGFTFNHPVACAANFGGACDC